MSKNEHITYNELPDDLKRIRWCESYDRHFLPDGSVIKGIQNPLDIGRYMINLHYHKARADALGIDLFNESGNEAYARILYNEQGSKPWYWSYDPITKKCINGVVIPEKY